MRSITRRLRPTVGRVPHKDETAGQHREPVLVKKGMVQGVMRYIVEGRVGDRWISIGQPIADHDKASMTMEAALESGEWHDARILVVNKDRKIVRIID